MSTISSRAYSGSKTCIRTMVVRVCPTYSWGYICANPLLYVPSIHILWMCVWAGVAFVYSFNKHFLPGPASVFSRCYSTNPRAVCGVLQPKGLEMGTHHSSFLSDGQGRQQLPSPSLRQIERSWTFFFFSAPTLGRSSLEDTVWKGELYYFLNILMGHGERWSRYLKLGVNSFLYEVK